jgi:protoporphyrin/coproporphyrin ferrochelatase
VLRAVLLVSHGTVDDLGDLAAFTTNIRRGQPPSAELVAELRRHYQAIGGKSPLNAISAEVARKLERKLELPVAWASRLWKPTVRDVLGGLVRDGVGQVALVPLAQHSAHVYAEDARRAAEGMAVQLACAPNWGTNRKLLQAFADRIVPVLAADGELAHTTLVMTAHSLPKAAVERGDPYEREVRSAAQAVAAMVRERVRDDVRCAVAFQSQGLADSAARRPIEWLGPDLRAALDEARARGHRRIVLAPIGFLADHVEILYDLDIDARAMAKERELEYRRTPSLNADDDLVEALADVARPLLGHG